MPILDREHLKYLILFISITMLCWINNIPQNILHFQYGYEKISMKYY
jgi:hypothetical protein